VKRWQRFILRRGWFSHPDHEPVSWIPSVYDVHSFEMGCRATDNKRLYFAWIWLLGISFIVPYHCGAQQRPSSPASVVRLPIIEGRDIRFRKLSNPQKLSHVRVESVVQDTPGFMWFGTWNGLNRYDGYKFEVFKHQPGDPKSLSGVYVRALFRDHSGNLWVRTEGFLDRFQPKTESFTHYNLDKLAKKGLSSIVNHQRRLER
jgi:hypothetical protein